MLINAPFLATFLPDGRVLLVCHGCHAWAIMTPVPDQLVPVDMEHLPECAVIAALDQASKAHLQ